MILRWTLEEVDADFTSKYRIRCLFNGKVLAAECNSMSNGAKLFVYDEETAGSSQYWNFIRIDGLRIVSQADMDCAVGIVYNGYPYVAVLLYKNGT